MNKIQFTYAEKTAEISTPDIMRVSLSSGVEVEVIRNADGQKELNIGRSEKREMTLRKLHLLIRKIVRTAKNNKAKKIQVQSEDFIFPQLKLSDKELGRIFASESLMADFDFVKFKTEPKEGWNFLNEIIISGKASPQFKEGIRVGEIIGTEVNASRILSNTPGGEMTPRLLVSETQKAIEGTRIRLNVLDRAEMKAKSMGAILGVAQGSTEEPQFIILEYYGGKSRNDRPIVLVGKGVTFDTGGLNLKPSDGIYEMHMDMSGGAAVIHAVIAAAKMGVKKNIIALVPAVENMPSGSSYRPGDVLRSMSGKTIEVLNTDAEGRIILADALHYAKQYNPRLVVDVATLTGAAMVALGKRASAFFTENFKISTKLIELGELTGDFVWPMPLWEEYESEVKGTFGDVANLGKYARMGGAIVGAVFLWQFVKDYPKDCPWVHIDMAPRMTALDDEFLAKGSVGAPVKLLTKLIENY